MLSERLALEFPHLGREQLQAHEAHCDALKFLAQRRAACLRSWRRERHELLRKTQGSLEDRLKGEDALSARRHEAAEVTEKQKRLNQKLQVERARVSAMRQEQQRQEEELQKRLKAVEAE